MIGALLARFGARRAWQAANRRDLDYLERWMADDCVIEVPGRPPIGGRFVGRRACREATQRWMDAFAFFEYRPVRITLEHPYALGLSNTVITEFELVLRGHDGRANRGYGVDVSTMRRGRLVAGRTYAFDLDAEEALRGADHDAVSSRAQSSAGNHTPTQY